MAGRLRYFECADFNANPAQRTYSTSAKLRHDSKILENLINNDGLLVVGAEYSLETGSVDFFDGMPG